MSVVSMKQLLEAGVHFGHQTRRWNPKMKKYIFDARNGIYIIDLQKTLKLLEDAYNFVRDVAGRGGEILFVGTKKQAQDTVQEEAARSGQHFVNQRWLGGTLTNFKTLTSQIAKLKVLDTQKDGGYHGMTKKEALLQEKKRLKLEKYLSGIKDLDSLPAALFVIDPKKEKIAVSEANRLKIPVVGIVDTNCDPDCIDFVIPSNDDAIRAIKLIAGKVADAVIEGRHAWQEQKIAAASAAAEAAEKSSVSSIKVTVEDMTEGAAPTATDAKPAARKPRPAAKREAAPKADAAPAEKKAPAAPKAPRKPAAEGSEKPAAKPAKSTK
jgi:small subunit ribosomal protein S2